MEPQTLARLLEKVEGRYYGKYRGLVADNNDPEKLGRLRVRVPGILGDEVVTGWAMPCLPYGGAPDQGFYFIPEVGAGVWVEFEAGDLEFPIWTGTYWAKPGGTTEIPKPADAQAPPNCKIIKTVTGHTIEFSDANGDEHIRITDGVNKNRLELDKKGIVIEDANSNTVTMDSQGVTIKSSQVRIGGNADEPLVLGNSLQTDLTNVIAAIFNSHTHIGNLGAPTGPPVPQMMITLSQSLSRKHKIE